MTAVTVTGETGARAEALSSLALTARMLGLPLRDDQTVWLTEPDPVAAHVIGMAMEQCRAHGVAFTEVDDERRMGLEIDFGGVRYRVVHLRDAYLHGRERGETAAAVTS